MADIELARAAAAKVWGCGPREVSLQDISSLYPWAKRHALVMAVHSSFRRMAVAVAEDRTTIAFEDLKTPTLLNKLLEREEVRLPEAMTAEQLALAIRSLLLGPGGFVASQAFWEREKKAIKMWSSPSPDEGPAIFQKHCVDPALQGDSRQWTLRFFYFNNKGGIERWEAAGDERSVHSVQNELVVPDRTFLFPYG